jgi:outer membrane protein assembly factor BamA
LKKFRQFIAAFYRRIFIRISFVALICFISAGHVFALSDSISQIDSIHVTVPRDTFTRGNTMDIIDLIRLIVSPKKANIQMPRRTTGIFYTIVAYPGYSIATGVAGVAAVNISYRSKKHPADNLSFFNNNFQYTQNNQILVQSISNIYTNDSKWQFPGDIRFFRFPTSTYGIGSSTLPANADDIDYSHFRFYRTVLRQVVPFTFLGVGYNLDYRWNIVDDDAQNGSVTDFVKYGYKHTSSSSGLSFNFLYDSRDNANRPVTGTYVDIHFTSYLRALGSTSSWNSMVIDVRKYFPLSKKWYTELAVWGYAWLTLSGKPPYLDMPSTGWDSYNNTGRGYAAGRYRGRDMLYFETELRFDLLPSGLLGAVVFGSLQSFTEYGGTYFGPVQPGGGAGVRIKFNKLTSSNSCLDYGFGAHGSKGFATNLNEVF